MTNFRFSTILLFHIFTFFKYINLKLTDEKISNLTLLCSILINMDNDEIISSEKYNKYYSSNNAIEGIKEIIKRNNFYINNFPIPGAEKEFKIEYPEGYIINKKKWLTYSDGKYQVMFNGNFDNYEDASYATATGYLAGLEFRLYDTNGDNFTDIIKTDYVESFIISKIVEIDNETFYLYRSNIEDDMKLINDGREYDDYYFNNDWKEKILKKNYDNKINIGDIALFAYKPEGWVIEKGREVKGILTKGKDHEYYQIGEQKYQDAMRFSRDNIIISNRCGEYLNSHKYFGFLGNEQNLEISLWFINNIDKNRYGAPCGFTSGKNAKAFLLKAMEISQKKINSVIISEDGSSVEKGQKYVTRNDYENFRDFIARAEMASCFDLPHDIYDYNVYLLYLANHGSQDDIGAQFAGYNYTGFDNQIKIK